jgi:hypothetical protein
MMLDLLLLLPLLLLLLGMLGSLSNRHRSPGGSLGALQQQQLPLLLDPAWRLQQHLLAGAAAATALAAMNSLPRQQQQQAVEGTGVQAPLSPRITSCMCTTGQYPAPGGLSCACQL